jgi:hypothetical protein
VVVGGRIAVAAGIAVWTGRVMVCVGLWPCELMCRV